MSRLSYPSITGLILSLTLCSITFFVARYAIIEYDHNQVIDTVEQIGNAYKTGGIQNVEEYITENNAGDVQKYPVILISVSADEALFFRKPEQWSRMDSENLMRGGEHRGQMFFLLLESGEEIEVIIHELPEEHTLQVGVDSSILERRLQWVVWGCLLMLLILGFVLRKATLPSSIITRFGHVSNTLLFGLMLRMGAIFLLALVLIATAVMIAVPLIIQGIDRDDIRELAIDAINVYEEQGEEAFSNWIRQFEGDEFFIRMIRPDKVTLSHNLHPVWREFDIEEIVHSDLPDKEWIVFENRFDRVDIYVKSMQNEGVLYVGGFVASAADIRSPLIISVFIIFMPALLIGLIGGFVLSKRSIKPIGDMINTLEHVRNTGDLGRRVTSNGGSHELEQMVHLFNSMQDRIQSLIAQLQQSLDHVAHDLRTPLTRLRSKAELALHGKPNLDAYSDALASNIEETEYVLKMLNTIMDLAEAKAGTLKIRAVPVNLAELLEKIVDLYEFVAEEKNIVITLEATASLSVPVDELRIQQAVANLIDNAIKYTPASGRVWVRMQEFSDRVQVSVSDSGIGIPEEHKNRIWDRLFRVESSRSTPGVGLGLSLVKAIVVAHKGHVDVQTNEYGGSDFTITLPL